MGAWIFQYGLGYAPCTLCYWQRHAHKIVIGVALTAIFAQIFLPSGSINTVFRWLLVLAFLGSASVAFFHVGVEFLWWEGPQACATGTPQLGGALDILGDLDKKMKPPACKDVAWSLFGISMAGYNMLASLLGAALGNFAKPNKGTL